MKQKDSLWQKLGLHEWFLRQEQTGAEQKDVKLTPDDVYRFIVERFHESIAQLSFANRIVFYHEFIVCFNPEDYKEFVDNKKGIFGLIIQESLQEFYRILAGYRKEGKTVAPSSNKWVFRFVSHPEYRRGDKSLIGKLLPGSTQQKDENLRITFIPRQTGIGETFDVSDDILKNFTFYSEGYYELPFLDDISPDTVRASSTQAKVFARLETIIPDREYAGKKIEFLMKEGEITVSGREEHRESGAVFRVPSEWVNTPHLRIRYDQSQNKFYLASLGEKTIVNEREVPQSDLNRMHWIELPLNSRIVLNGIVGINIFKG